VETSIKCALHFGTYLVLLLLESVMMNTCAVSRCLCEHLVVCTCAASLYLLLLCMLEIKLHKHANGQARCGHSRSKTAKYMCGHWVHTTKKKHMRNLKN